MQKLTIADLAHWDHRRGGDDLRLTIAQGHHDRRRNHGAADDVLGILDISAAGHDVEPDRRALLGDPAVIQVVDVTGLALVEDGGVTEGDGAIPADRESGRVESASLRGTVELELEVVGQVRDATLGILHDGIGDLDNENTLAGAGPVGGARLCRRATLVSDKSTIRYGEGQAGWEGGSLTLRAGLASWGTMSWMLISKRPSKVGLHPGGAAAVGAMLSVTAWATTEVAAANRRVMAWNFIANVLS